VKNVIRPWLLVIFSALSLFATEVAYAQNYQTTLTGTVMDTTGAIVPNANIRIVSAGTNAVRETEATGSGTYSVGNLPIGRYNLTVSSAGFGTVEIKDIELKVGQTRNLDLRLNIGAVAQEVRVEDNAPVLQTNTAEIGAVIQNQQIKDLPLNGRNIASLLALVPGAIDSGGGTLSTIRFAGRGVDDTNFRLDGVDATGIRAQNPNANLRLVTSTESISELKVATLLYGADTGGTAGGQVELVSKSGTNTFHGGIFDFLRNNYFDARGPFDAKSPSLKLNDFGASIGGPIIKDKTFFFGVYEGLRQNVAANLIAVVPTASYRASVIATSPALSPFISAYPIGNGVALDGNRINYSSPTATRQTEDSYLFRVQHVFNEKNNAFVRYNIDHANITGPSGALRDRSITNTSPMNATAQYVHVFTPTLVNEAIIGFNRQWSVGSTAGYLTTSQDINYALSVSGFTSLTNSRASESAPSTYSLLDNLTKTFGRHTIKTGVELKELQYNYSQAGVHQLQYNGVTQFQTNKLDSVSVVADVPVHGLHKLETFAYAQDTFKLRSNLTLTYGLRYAFLNVLHEVHGRSQAWDNVTCGGTCPVGGQFTTPVYNDLEPRFSFGWEPAWLRGKTSLRGGFGLYHGEGQIGDLNAPSDNYTTLFGLTPAVFPGLSWPIDNFVSLAATNPSAVQPRGLARQRQDPRVTQYGLQVQTALPYQLILDTGYIGSWGDHQFTRTYKNDYLYGTTTRPFAGVGQVDYKDAISTTNFNGWQTSLQRQFRTGLRMQFNYLWSHSINDGTTGGGESDYPNNDHCLGCEYASSDQDARHVISADAIYMLPVGRGQRFLNHGIAGALLGGISLAPVYTFRSGLPINVVLDRPAAEILDGNNTDHNAGVPNLRPDLVPGVSLTPPEGRSNKPGGRWINSAAFAVPAHYAWGNAPRNLLRGPALMQADLGTAKRFPIFKDRVSGQFRAEIFNLFNRSQYANPVSNFTTIGNPQLDLRTQTSASKIASDNAAIAAASASFSQTSAVVNTGATGGGTPRRIQFGLRFDY
jgi:hypothetical protein